MSEPQRHVAVVGCGLIGASFALASMAADGVGRVTVTDRDADVRRRARDAGIGDVVEDELAPTVADADVVLLAVPVAVLADTAAAVAGKMKPGAVLTDTGSVKADVVPAIESLADAAEARHVHFIGGHPMAGSERSGVDAADGTLFQGATWVLTPTARSDADAFNRLSAHLRAIGARVLAVDPKLHDTLVAVASHLPQVLASTLMVHAAGVSRTTGEGILSVAGGGFRDVTRIAASDPDLWVGILSQNREAVLSALDGFAGRLDAFRQALVDEDDRGLREVLAAGREARLTLPGKATVGELVDLVVPLEDQPGMLATVTTALGEAGVNIEDLAMRHATAGRRGALVVAVAGHDLAERARRILAERGLASHLEAR